MVKGTKRQIIFLPNLQGAGKGIFECAYFVLRADHTEEDAGEADMLAEAERIVAEAEKLRMREATGVSSAARTAANGKKPARRRRVAPFMTGFLIGAAAVLAGIILWHITHS